MRARTQVGIVGAGPAGLVLAHLLRQAGVSSVVLESRSREYVESRVRAGLIENRTVELLDRHGLADRLRERGMPHLGTELRSFGRRLRIPYGEGADGRAMVVYPQQDLVADLIRLWLDGGGELHFEVEDVSLAGLDGGRPVISYRYGGGVSREVECDLVAGCDGSHGVCRGHVPEGAMTELSQDIPIAWLGVLARIGPSTDEIIYSLHEHGFAGHMLRTSEVSRFYLQVRPGEPLEEWPDDRIWAELQARLQSPGWTLAEGPIFQKNVADMRSVVVEPMRWRSLFLLGDAAHIVPPTGAKGMNLAIGDAGVLAAAIAEWCAGGDARQLDEYSDACLTRVWRAQEFSLWMTALVHRMSDDPHQRRLQRARFDSLMASPAARRTFAESYAGLN
jgi:p-hydroxybenzoate 3-monooxygenase